MVNYINNKDNFVDFNIKNLDTKKTPDLSKHLIQLATKNRECATKELKFGSIITGFSLTFTYAVADIYYYTTTIALLQLSLLLFMTLGIALIVHSYFELSEAKGLERNATNLMHGYAAKE